jgi:hypothetical protein
MLERSIKAAERNPNLKPEEFAEMLIKDNLRPDDVEKLIEMLDISSEFKNDVIIELLISNTSEFVEIIRKMARTIIALKKGLSIPDNSAAGRLMRRLQKSE